MVFDGIIERAGLADIHAKVQAGERLSAEDGLRLYASDDLPILGYMANVVRERLNGDTTYYVRAIEAASPVMGADPLGCQRDASGRCVELDPCFDRPDDDDCRSPSEQRAWSSPIFVDYWPSERPSEQLSQQPSEQSEEQRPEASAEVARAAVSG